MTFSSIKASRAWHGHGKRIQMIQIGHPQPRQLSANRMQWLLPWPRFGPRPHEEICIALRVNVYSSLLTMQVIGLCSKLFKVLFESTPWWVASPDHQLFCDSEVKHDRQRVDHDGGTCWDENCCDTISWVMDSWMSWMVSGPIKMHGGHLWYGILPTRPTLECAFEWSRLNSSKLWNCNPSGRRQEKDPREHEFAVFAAFIKHGIQHANTLTYMIIHGLSSDEEFLQTGWIMEMDGLRTLLQPYRKPGPNPVEVMVVGADWEVDWSRHSFEHTLARGVYHRISPFFFSQACFGQKTIKKERATYASQICDLILSSGNFTYNCGKSPFLRGTSTINGNFQ